VAIHARRLDKRGAMTMEGIAVELIVKSEELIVREFIC
jgi:hypothetical protein